jgi:hypothetical protein
MTLDTWKQDIEDHPSVQEAGKAVAGAKAKLAGVVEEVEALRAELADTEARIQEVTEAGDPEGIVRDLSRKRRELGERLEEAEADLQAQESARTGAYHALHRARLAAMGETWTELPLEDVGERFRARVRELAAVIEEVQGLYVAQKWGHDTTNHVLGRILQGNGQGPNLPSPRLGIPEQDFRRFAREVEGVAQRFKQES